VRAGIGVIIDPVSLTVLDKQTGSDAIDWVRALHTNLLIEGSTGRSVVGWTGVGLLALAHDCVVIWWPEHGRCEQGSPSDPSARGHMFYRRLHGAPAFGAEC